MSNIYIQEPATSGKVIVNTTVGPIDIELWAKETPRACRNFMQLCMEGYYDNTIFHRVVKGFIVQGGDPTGAGTGGQSIYSREGKPWKSEFHSRLRFVRRGLVAAADEGSQFFFTLGDTRELQDKHTIFGKVAGDTIYNMIRLEQGSLGEEGRPDFPHKILSVKIVENPFRDLDEEEYAAKRRAAKALADAEAEKKKGKKKKGTKDFKLLSFGDEAEAEEVEVTTLAQKAKTKSKSFHDLGDDPKMISATGVEKVDVKVEPMSDCDEGKDPVEDVQEDGRPIIIKIERELDEEEARPKEDSIPNRPIKKEPGSEEPSSDEEERRPKICTAKFDKPGKKEKKSREKEKRRLDEKKKNKPRLLTRSDEYTATLKMNKERQSRAKQLKGARREDETLKFLAKFREKLMHVPNDEEEEKRDDEKETDTETEKAADDKGLAWMGHKLKFEAKDAVLAKDASTKGDDWYEVFDPRNPINKRRREKGDQRSDSSTKRRR